MFVRTVLSSAGPKLNENKNMQADPQPAHILTYSC